MKVLLIFAIAIYGVHSITLTKQIIAERFEDFKITHQKTYLNVKEEAFRKQIFQTKLEHIVKHNEKYRQGLVSYEMGINKFADMTDDEMKAYTHGLVMPAVLPKPVLEIVNRTSLGMPENVQIPGSIDWRDYGIITPVKNQGGCGACWAFAANGALEAQMRKAYGADYQVSLSEQQLVDCMAYDDGCVGGWMATAYEYIGQNGGIDNDQVYPYEAKKGNCRYTTSAIAGRVTGYAYLTGPDENAMADMVYNKGPVSVAIDADGDFGYYSSGVYYNPTCDSNHYTHAVVVVGYGSENGQDYWLAKNSWGADWGDHGYIKMARNRDNNCGIAGAASYPVF